MANIITYEAIHIKKLQADLFERICKIDAIISNDGSDWKSRDLGIVNLINKDKDRAEDDLKIFKNGAVLKDGMAVKEKLRFTGDIVIYYIVEESTEKMREHSWYCLVRDDLTGKTQLWCVVPVPGYQSKKKGFIFPTNSFIYDPNLFLSIEAFLYGRKSNP
jgi:hypothetical protein